MVGFGEPHDNNSDRAKGSERKAGVGRWVDQSWYVSYQHEQCRR